MKSYLRFLSFPLIPVPYFLPPPVRFSAKEGIQKQGWKLVPLIKMLLEPFKILHTEACIPVIYV